MKLAMGKTDIKERVDFLESQNKELDDDKLVKIIEVLEKCLK